MEIARKEIRRSSDRFLLEVREILDRIGRIIEQKDEEMISGVFDVWKRRDAGGERLGRRGSDRQLEGGILDRLETISEKLVQLKVAIEDLEKTLEEERSSLSKSDS